MTVGILPTDDRAISLPALPIGGRNALLASIWRSWGS